ncbi:hypothetical protein L1049_001782 [Liquidambar formosana]|uniref:Uncharacterized protein n=1 Tax=Liquidambar formosana TaxID=63359 RepID=A0AAP0N2R7_LIQFO
MVVSIGPYHHGKKELCAMEEQKLRCLQSLLERREENTERHILALAKLEEEACKFYADPIDLNPEAFAKIFLIILDAWNVH